MSKHGWPGYDFSHGVSGFLASLAAAGSTLLNGLVSYWPLNEQSGTRYDAVGSNDLTDNNTVGAVSRGPSGTVGVAVRGNAEGLRSDAAGLKAARSFSTWIRRASTGNYPDYQGIMQFDVAGRGLEIFGGSSIALLYFGVHEGDGAEVSGPAVGSEIADTDWHLISLWADTDVGKLWHKIDDRAAVSSDFDGTVLAAPSTFILGSWSYGQADQSIGPSGVWSTAIGESIHDSLFNSGNGKRYADLTAAEKVGLVSYWNLDEASGNRADSHGSNTLTDNNTVGSIVNTKAAMNGAAASFVRANQEYLSKTGVVLPDEFTIAGWASYAPLTPTGDVLVSVVGSWPNSVQAQIYMGQPNLLYLLVADGGTYAYAGATLGGGIDYAGGGWFHFIAWQGADLVPHISVNNVAEYQGATPNQTGLYRTAQPLWIGRGTDYLGGTVDEVAIWSRVLTEDERTELYAAGKGKFYV